MRKIVWIGLAVVMVAAAAVWLGPRLLGSDASRHEVEAILSEALGRPVTIEALEVASDAPEVELRGVVVAQPEALATPDEGPLLRAERVRLEVGLTELLARRVVGSARAQGVTLTVLERGGQTSVHGLGRRPEGKGKGQGAEPVELALELELRGVALRLVDLDRAEAIDVRDVELRGHLSGRTSADRPEREAVATLTAGALEVRGVALREITVQVKLDGPAIALTRLHARIGEHGTLEGHGALGLPASSDPAEGDFRLELTLADARLDGPLRDLTAIAVPGVVRATGGPGSPTTGRLDADVRLQGRGLHWATIEPSLTGTAALQLHDVVVPADAMVLELASLAGRAPGPLTLDEARVELRVAEGWLTPQVLQLGTLRPPLEGRVSLRGALELRADLMPLVEQFGGGTYAAVARTTTSLPVRITGTVRAPKLAPPRVRDVAKGLLGGAIRRTLDPQ